MTRCHITLTGKKPRNPAYPRDLKTIGDHIRKVRLDRGLLQKEVAETLVVSEDTIVNWENNNSTLMIKYMPKIINFLGYQPTEKSEKNSWSSIILAYRERRGVRRKVLAKEMGIDERTLEKIEKGEGWFFERTKEKIRLFISKITTDNNPDELV